MFAFCLSSFMLLVTMMRFSCNSFGMPPLRIPTTYRSWTTVLLADSNSRLGSLTTTSVGPHHADTENVKGAIFHRWLVDHGLHLPQTHADCHSGPGHYIPVERLPVWILWVLIPLFLCLLPPLGSLRTLIWPSLVLTMRVFAPSFLWFIMKLIVVLVMNGSREMPPL